MELNAGLQRKQLLSSCHHRVTSWDAYVNSCFLTASDKGLFLFWLFVFVVVVVFTFFHKSLCMSVVSKEKLSGMSSHVFVDFLSLLHLHIHSQHMHLPPSWHVSNDLLCCRRYFRMPQHSLSNYCVLQRSSPLIYEDNLWNKPAIVL